MAQSQCLKIKLKEGQTERFVSWARSLASRSEEVRRTLAAEGMLVEALCLERSAEGDFLVLYTRARDLVEANRAMMASQDPFDVETRQLMAETWDTTNVRSLEVLFEF
jgi:hypothetical protein